MDPLNLVFVVLGIAIGVLSSHATLGKDIRQALTEIKDLARRVGDLEGARDRAVLHFHRRSSDVVADDEA